MIPRIICPHCHCAIDPFTLEAAVSARAQYRICPECDGPITVAGEDAGDAVATALAAIDEPAKILGQVGACSPPVTREGQEGLDGSGPIVRRDAATHDIWI